MIAATLIAQALLLSTSELPASATTSARATTTTGPIMGGLLYATGAAIDVEVLASAGTFYTSELLLFDGGSSRVLTTTSSPGTVVPIGAFPSGTELVFGIRVLNTGEVFRTGPPDRNPDNTTHATVELLEPGRVRLAFEDVYGGGDRDFDDAVFELRGGVSITDEGSAQPSPSRPATGTLRLLTWNVQGKDWERAGLSAHDFASAITATGADVVGLQEIRGSQAEQIAHSLGWSNLFWAPAQTKGQCELNWRCRNDPNGNAIISRYPIRDPESVDLSPKGTDKYEGQNTRILMSSIVSVDGHELLFYTAHLGLTDGRAPPKQIRFVADHVRENLERLGPNTPTAVVGDFNAKPWDPGMRVMSELGFGDVWGEVWPESLDKRQCAERRAKMTHGPTPAQRQAGKGASRRTDGDDEVRRTCGFTAPVRTDDLQPSAPFRRLDYIFTRGTFDKQERWTPWFSSASQAEMRRFQRLSDHFPVAITVTISSPPRF